MKHQLKRNKTNENLNIISPNQYPYKIKRNIFHNLSIKNMNNNITSLNHNNNILDSKSMHNLNNLSNLNNLNNLSKSNIYKKSIILKSSMTIILEISLPINEISLIKQLSYKNACSLFKL